MTGMTTFELRNAMQAELNKLAETISRLEKTVKKNLNDAILMSALQDAYTRRNELEKALRLIGEFDR